MFSITLICMGKLKERFYTEAAAEYAKRLRAYCDFQLIELPECRLPEDPNDTQIAQGLTNLQTASASARRAAFSAS